MPVPRVCGWPRCVFFYLKSGRFSVSFLSKPALCPSKSQPTLLPIGSAANSRGGSRPRHESALPEIELSPVGWFFACPVPEVPHVLGVRPLPTSSLKEGGFRRSRRAAGKARSGSIWSSRPRPRTTQWKGWPAIGRSDPPARDNAGNRDFQPASMSRTGARYMTAKPDVRGRQPKSPRDHAGDLHTCPVTRLGGRCATTCRSPFTLVEKQAGARAAPPGDQWRDRAAGIARCG